MWRALFQGLITYPLDAAEGYHQMCSPLVLIVADETLVRAPARPSAAFMKTTVPLTRAGGKQLRVLVALFKN